MYHCGKVSNKMRKQAWKPYTDIVPCNARKPQSSRCTDHDKKSLGEFCTLFDAYSAKLCVGNGRSVVNSFPDGQVRNTNCNQGETNNDRSSNCKILHLVFFNYSKETEYIYSYPS